MAEGTTKDFFISYNQADHSWAEWIAWQLEAEGYSTMLQAWDFRPGGNFVLQMDEAVTHTKRTILLLSPNYLDLKAVYSHAEWAATFVKDPDGHQGILLPIRVRDCKPTGLLAAITYLDFVSLDAATARRVLLAEVRQSRIVPSVEPLFPGSTPSALPPVPGFPGDWPEIWYVPYPRNPFFTGRDELLAHVREQLTSKKLTALAQAKAISGLGGIGKTQTALEYAYRYGHEYRYVLWINVTTEESLRAEIVQLAVHLQIPGQDIHDQHRTIEALKQWLVQCHDWLLILDNADNLELVSKYLPRGNKIQGHLLLTTRASAGGAFAQIIEVEKMGIDEGILLLLRRARQIAVDAPLKRSTRQDRAEAQAIVVALDGLPLALDQAGAYIEEMDITLSSYLRLYQTRRKALLSHRGQLPPGHPDTVATTWDLSFQQVAQANPATANLLRFCAFLAPDVIPETIITQGVSVPGEWLEDVATDPTQLNAAIQILRRYSLIRRNRQTSTLSMHRLVQAVLHDTMTQEEQRVWAERAVRAVSAAFPMIDYGRWRQAQPYLSHTDACKSLIEQYDFTFPEAASLLYDYGLYFFYIAQYAEAEPLYRHALYIREQTVGPEHNRTADILQALASLYQQQARYIEAEPLYQRALHIYEQTKGAEHPRTADVLHALASLYQQQSKYAEAELLYQHVLRIREQVLGPEHPDTGSTLLALASLYQQQDKCAEAEPLYLRALHIHEQMLESEHPRTADVLHALASLYQQQARYAEAEPLYQRALHIREQALGPEHRRTGTILHALGALYHQQGRYAEAEPLYLHALHIAEQERGPEHPDTSTTLDQLACIYLEQGKHAAAESLYLHALHIYEQALGPEHLSTKATLDNLISLYQQQGKHAEIEKLYLSSSWSPEH